MKKQKCFYPCEGQVKRDWIVVDARGQILGRLASDISKILRGKDRADFTPSATIGNNVIVINAEHLVVTGAKAEQKIYYHASGYPGGLKQVKYRDAFAKDPTFVLRKAVQGMLPDNRLKSVFMRSLKIYRGEHHPHDAQKAVVQ